MRLKLHVQYDGSSFSGLQKQRSLPTIEGVFRKGIHTLSKRSEAGGGGAHRCGGACVGQVSACGCEEDMSFSNIWMGLTAFLPKTVKGGAGGGGGRCVPCTFPSIFKALLVSDWNRRQLRPDLLGAGGAYQQAVDVPRMRQAID